MLTTIKIANSFCYWDQLFSNDDLNNIIEYCDTIEKTKGTVSFNETNDSIRNSDIAWINVNEKTEWIFRNMHSVLNIINTKHYGFDIFGFDKMQYTVYSGEGSHYDWHWDMFTENQVTINNTPNQRKLSLVLQLSDPSEYEGGDLQLSHSGMINTIEKKKGFITVFPSFITHRVTPIESGVRKTLVAWATGPDWR